ncbi:MAG: FAD-dependent oxidoreductase, partial [Thermoplasmata archaeon]|nr:FAD-dependent oxidoreductase [Thermoplasmata archaeon]
GKKVVLVEKMAHLLPVAFDTDMAKRVSKALPGGIDIRLSAPLEKIEGTGKVEAIEVGGDRIVVDTVLLSMGVAPETNLAQAIGLETTKMGIVVDEHMRTNDPDIYAVGDCIQSWSRVTGKPMASRLAPPALAQGAVAGLNIAGEETGYPGSLGAFVTVIGGVQFASTGIRACDLEGGGSARITVGAKPDYMGGEEVTIKLVAMEDGKVAGAQVVGPCAAELVNRVAIAITAGLVLSDLVRTEIAYCPPVNDAFDPLVLVAETLIKRFRRKKR